jgi:hypothetical protein
MVSYFLIFIENYREQRVHDDQMVAKLFAVCLFEGFISICLFSEF